MIKLKDLLFEKVAHTKKSLEWVSLDYIPMSPKVMKQIMGGVVSQIGTLKGFCDMLVTRIKTMNNDMIRLDTSVSAALDLYPDLDRIARAENFVEDGSIDVRRD